MKKYFFQKMSRDFFVIVIVQQLQEKFFLGVPSSMQKFLSALNALQGKK